MGLTRMLCSAIPSNYTSTIMLYIFHDFVYHDQSLWTTENIFNKHNTIAQSQFILIVTLLLEYIL